MIDADRLKERIEYLRASRDARSRIGVLGPDGQAGAWAALGQVLRWIDE